MQPSAHPKTIRSQNTGSQYGVQLRQNQAGEHFELAFVSRAFLLNQLLIILMSVDETNVASAVAEAGPVRGRRPLFRPRVGLRVGGVRLVIDDEEVVGPEAAKGGKLGVC
jgi:hypothetical protein